MSTQTIDPVTLTILNNNFVNVCREMGITMARTAFSPIFNEGLVHEGELCGFVANVGHLAEIGGKAVGSFAADATEVFQEGLRIPPVKIVKRDEHDLELWKLIMANHRTPRNTWGDLNAQIASLRVAERRVLEMLDRYGRDLVERAADELMEYSERWM